MKRRIIMDNKERFAAIFKSVITRPGADNLFAYLENSDFFTAPASTRFHCDYPGGLLEHSLNVYDCLKSLVDCSVVRDVGLEYSEETLAVVSLLHDLCKVGVYKESTRNVKKDGKWETVPYYEFDDQIPFGHGEKSQYIAASFIKLSREESFAIRYHMGYSEEFCDRRNVGKAFEMFPLALLLHQADQMAASLVEGK